MKKTHLIAVLGMLTALNTCPVQADSIRDDKQDVLKPGDVRQNEGQSKESSRSTLIVDDAEKKYVDCFYTENAPDPLCKK